MLYDPVSAQYLAMGPYLTTTAIISHIYLNHQHISLSKHYPPPPPFVKAGVRDSQLTSSIHIANIKHITIIISWDPPTQESKTFTH